MNPELHLCAHLDAETFGRFVVRTDEIFEWSNGPVSACARCSDCSEAALLERVAVAPDRHLQIYRVAALRGDDLNLFQRNVGRGSCDLARRTLEIEALFAAAGPPSRLVACEGDRLDVVASIPWPKDVGREGSSSDRGSGWFERLGLRP